ncbi:hypothetical protein GCM10010502_63630 [Kitasatospora aureofaciens]|uniref:Uncharacterized protein n=1 Tax=Kitasatospora aureofaciens TaxID=1894 RepID=A0A8H9LYG5_KITAU|nr:hypothetical protein GCM10010502_63630 [Kitasatospora aureofaciens]
MTALVDVLITLTVPSPKSLTYAHRPLGVMTTPTGPAPTGTVATGAVAAGAAERSRADDAPVTIGEGQRPRPGSGPAFTPSSLRPRPQARQHRRPSPEQSPRHA